MSCGCGKHKDRNGRQMPEIDAHDILPSEPCVFCAEKHLSYAYHLSKEVGYSQPNRDDIIGALVAAQWHVHPFSMPIAKALRVIRHQIQERKEADVDWLPVISAMDTLVTSTIREISAASPPPTRTPSANPLK